MAVAQTKSHWVLPRIPPLRKIAFDAAAWWQSLTELENLCSLADVSEDFFDYVASPVVRRELKRTVRGSGSTGLVWPQLTRPLSSNVVGTTAVLPDALTIY
jgi:hypothetical protein